MLDSFIRTSDLWIFLPSTIGILLLAHTGKLRLAGCILLIATTITVGNGYGLLRAIAHALIMLALAFGINKLLTRRR